MIWMVLVAGLAACAQFPELDEAPTGDATADSFPALVPLDAIALPETQPRLDATSEARLQGRIGGVRQRAEALRSAPTD
ncbi:hypothetical protein [Shimia sp.]|uniref:hypothetical protein n=1 Tax=Shimia sp. TaxID=1954381 RepID=UPI00356B5E23